MIILGIDPALAKTGWGIIEVKETIKLISYGTIKTKPKDELSIRLHHIYASIFKIINENSVWQVGIEETFVNSNFRTSLSLAYARGVLLMAPSVFKIPVINLTPAEVKLAVTGSGKAEKEDVLMKLRFIIEGLGSNEISLDESDALAIAVATSLKLKREVSFA